MMSLDDDMIASILAAYILAILCGLLFENRNTMTSGKTRGPSG